MTLLHLVIRSLVHYWRTGRVIVFGVAVAVAALVGSLLVGHSVTGSLRDTALARLGSITHVLTSSREFRAALAADLRKQAVRATAPLYLAIGAVTNADTDAVIPNVNIIGVDDDFWAFYGAAQHLENRQAILNNALARDLNIGKDGACLVSLIHGGAMSSGNLFAQRSLEASQRTLRVTVADILPDRGPGGFSLAAGSDTPRNLFVSRAWLVNMLDKADVANNLLIANSDASLPELSRLCTLQDYGLSMTTEEAGFTVKSDGTVLPPAIVKAIAHPSQLEFQRVSSMNLAATIRRGNGQSIAYAILMAVGSLDHVHPDDCVSRDDGISLNTWAAQELGATVGETVTVEYLVPSLDGAFHTKSMRLVVERILPMESLASFTSLVPPIEGITDATRIDAWKAPFPVDLHRVTARDEEYWRRYRTTPKAFISLKAMQQIWASGPDGGDAGWITAIRSYSPVGKVNTLRGIQPTIQQEMLQCLKPEDAGMLFRPVRAQALQAAAGTTDFGQLFIAMSIFLIAAAAGLAGTLMRLLAEGRAGQAGVMLAQGFTPKLVTRVFLLEGLALAGIGTLIGVPLGILYAWGIIRGLTSWWQGAVSDTALWLHLGAAPLLIGALSGLLIGLLAMLWGVRGLTRQPVLKLLGGWQALSVLPRRGRTAGVMLIIALLLAMGMLALGVTKTVSPAVAFFMVGGALLVAGLCAGMLFLARALKRPAHPVSLGKLALRNAAVNRGRSLLVAGLLAGAAFLVVTVAANERDFARTDARDLHSGTGGFALRAIATSQLPYDFSTPEGRAHLGFTKDDEHVFAKVTVMPFLMSPGDDISCLNLNRPVTPRILGVPDAMITRGGFTVHPGWQALMDDTDAIPAIGDADSLEWSLHSGVGQRFPLATSAGTQPLRFTGSLASSIFSGELLVSDKHFKRLYPGVVLPRYYLIAVPPGHEKAVTETLRRTLGELGVEVRDTREILNSFVRVQNTYLSMFLAIGGLGMLLGTVGLLAVLLRNALERRREFALMLATGYTRENLAQLLLLENAGLLVAGLLLGTVAALIAVAPQFVARDARTHWGTVIGLLCGMLVIGLLSCRAAARTAAQGALLESLRGE